MKKLGIIFILCLFLISPILVVSFVILPTRAAEPSPTIKELQRWVYNQGYNYTVGENWITQLSPEQRETLCGLRQLEAPTKPVSGNIRFFSHAPQAQTQALGTPPPTYDAMALGYVTPVKDQGLCGSCWLHAACADFESDVAIREPPSLPDFCEQEVGDCHIWSSAGGHNWCSGGNDRMTTNYFTIYGAADETCHPYAQAPQTCYGCPLLKNVDNWRIITGDDGDSLTQVPAIKNAILNYGPVYSTIYASSAFQAYSGGVYEDWSPSDPDHAILIIGWDDTKPHSHGNGAWLIKNSWGTGWGANVLYPGCAWVAYGSANLGDQTSAICGYGQPGNTIYYHDECGWMGYRWRCGNPTAYGAVRFTPSQDSILTAVDFWAVDTSMNYEIKIFDDRTDLGGGSYRFSKQLGSTQAGTTNEMGYYSIPLNTPVPLTGGDDFIVQVRLTGTLGYPIPIDYCTQDWLPDWSAIAEFSQDSYISCDGTSFAWPYDAAVGQYFDVGIRARTALPDLVVSKSIGLSGGNFTVSYNVTNIGNAGAGNSTTGKFVNGTLEGSQPCPALGPGESYNGTFAPEPCLCGQSLNVTVCADNGDVIAESDETNNCEINIVDCPATPDLVITEKSEEWVDFEAKTYNITYTVTNRGCATAVASNTTITINGTDTLEEPVPPLAAGANYSNTVGPFTMSGDSANVTVCADNDDVVDESDETNNCQTNILEYPGYNITLSTNWNLVSLPLIPDNTSIVAVTAAINTTIGIIWYYDAGTATWLWYVPGNAASTLSTIEDGKGYWFFMNSPATLEGSGWELPGPGAPPAYDVFVGWNLIGFSSTRSTSPQSYLASIAGAYSLIYGWDAQGQTWLWYVPDYPSSTLTTMEPGHGYWLLATGDGTIVPPA